VLAFERSFVPIGVRAGGEVTPRPAGDRERGAPVPAWPRERGVEADAGTVQGDQQIAMHVGQPLGGHRLGDRRAEQLTGASAVEMVDAVHDRRLALGEARCQHLAEEQVLAGGRAATLAQHALRRLLAGRSVWQGAHGFDEFDERAVRAEESAESAAFSGAQLGP
jgi:hypothetical protein